MFEVVASHWEHIFFLLTSPKCALGEVEKPMFQGLVCHLELIFGHLIIPKCDLVKVEKSMLLGFELNFKFFGLWRGIKCYLGELKKTFSG